MKEIAKEWKTLSDEEKKVMISIGHMQQSLYFVCLQKYASLAEEINNQ